MIIYLHPWPNRLGPRSELWVIRHSPPIVQVFGETFRVQCRHRGLLPSTA